jgi:hypothetical protein
MLDSSSLPFDNDNDNDNGYSDRGHEVGIEGRGETFYRIYRIPVGIRQMYEYGNDIAFCNTVARESI